MISSVGCWVVQAWTISSNSAARLVRTLMSTRASSASRSARSMRTRKSLNCWLAMVAKPTQPSAVGSIEGWSMWRNDGLLGRHDAVELGEERPVGVHAQGHRLEHRQVDRARRRRWPAPPARRPPRPRAALTPAWNSPKRPPTARGGRSRRPREPVEPQAACSVNSVAGPVGPRAGQPERGDRHDDEVGVGPAQPVDVQVPVARRRRRRRRPGPRPAPTTERFEVFRKRKRAESSPSGRSTPAAVHRRSGSPSAVSTLTTSAPASASSLVAYGPGDLGRGVEHPQSPQHPPAWPTRPPAVQGRRGQSVPEVAVAVAGEDRVQASWASRASSSSSRTGARRPGSRWRWQDPQVGGAQVGGHGHVLGVEVPAHGQQRRRGDDVVDARARGCPGRSRRRSARRRSSPGRPASGSRRSGSTKAGEGRVGRRRRPRRSGRRPAESVLAMLVGGRPVGWRPAPGVG